MQQTGKNFLTELKETAESRVASGYYRVQGQAGAGTHSLSKSLLRKDRIPIIAEVKFRSPAEGKLSHAEDVGRIARAYEQGGASAISVLTEPEHFDGRLDHLQTVSEAVSLPILMKDVIVDERQVEAARRLGADAVLLIAGIYLDGACGNLASMVKGIHSRGMEAVLEVHDDEELTFGLTSKADVIGINNRNLDDFSVSLDVSRKLLRRGPFPKRVICESGISTWEQIESLRSLGAEGFLIGSALMRSRDPEESLRALSRLRT